MKMIRAKWQMRLDYTVTTANRPRLPPAAKCRTYTSGRDPRHFFQRERPLSTCFRGAEYHKNFVT